MTDYSEVVFIWLDEHIGLPDYCQALKKNFFSTLNPDGWCPTWLNNMDIDGYA
jgi:hypothetical protein